MSYLVHDGKLSGRFEAMIAGLETEGGMSIPKIAAKVGCSRQQIWRIASGQTKRPGYGIAVRIEKLHGQMTTKTRGLR
ncbi:helix-turn-helix domain-containing protein [Phyllobacterium sp. P5_D12]